jgi:UPF0716 protein FxsA
MAWLILLGLIALPVVEIALFIKASEAIGVVGTVAVAVLAGLGGIALLQRQGVTTLWRARQQLARGEMPVAEVFDGLCLALAGVLLVLPGLLTDAIGLVLLLPPVRVGLFLWLGRHLETSVVAGTGRRGPGATVIDVDYRVVPPRDDSDQRG